MNNRFLTMLLSITVISAAVFAGPASSDSPRPIAKRLSVSPGVTIKTKLGYYVECRYSGLGEVCEYVYAKPKGSAPGANVQLQRVKVKDSKLQKKLGYWVECRYSGLGDVCEYVYATVRKPAKPSP